ncbi:MAG TPA: CDP-alcohol phosphatidyltransferase family protein [Gemmatimonadaceae bacterium]|nr:CDP-alcohol phosphatidyltransferase family protein [Gemmatimonadaceae bacterium]
MKVLWNGIQRGYLRLIAPVGDYLVKKNVNPNAITTFGTLCTMAAGVIFATGHIRTAGWVLGLTALFDVLDGEVARRTGRSTTFGAFYDSTLDRVADGAVLGGLTVFFARNDVHHALPSWTGTPMVGVLLLGIIGTFLTSYTRARAEALGIELKNVGILQRPERITLLSAPQAFFGLTLNGWVLIAICLLLSLTAWVTAVQRILHVYRATSAERPARVRRSARVERSARPVTEHVVRGELPEPASYSTRPPH